MSTRDRTLDGTATVADPSYTQVSCHTFIMDGVSFSWWSARESWADDRSPQLVTVSAQWFGSKADVTRSDPETFARELAADLLRQGKPPRKSPAGETASEEPPADDAS